MARSFRTAYGKRMKSQAMRRGIAGAVQIGIGIPLSMGSGAFAAIGALPAAAASFTAGLALVGRGLNNARGERDVLAKARGMEMLLNRSRGLSVLTGRARPRAVDRVSQSRGDVRVASGRLALARAAAVRTAVQMRTSNVLGMRARAAAQKAGSDGRVDAYTRVQNGRAVQVQGYSRR